MPGELAGARRAARKEGHCFFTIYRKDSPGSTRCNGTYYDKGGCSFKVL